MEMKKNSSMCACMHLQVFAAPFIECTLHGLDDVHGWDRSHSAKQTEKDSYSSPQIIDTSANVLKYKEDTNKNRKQKNTVEAAHKSLIHQ